MRLGRGAAAIELPVVALLLPILLLSERWRWLALCFIVLIWLLRAIGDGRLTRPSPTNWVVFPFFLLAAATLVITLTPEITATHVSYLLAGLIVYISAVNWTVNGGRLWWLVTGLVILMILAAVASPFLVDDREQALLSWLPTRLVALSRALPERIHPNVLAGSLAVLLPLAIALAIRPLGDSPQQRTALRLLALVAALLLILDVFLLRTRGVLAAVAVVAAILLIVKWPVLLRTWPLWLAAATVALAQQWPQRLAVMFLGDGAFAGWRTRLDIWAQALLAIREFAITGVGMGAWETLAPLLYPYREIPPSKVIPHAHNLLLQVGVDLGVPGLVLYTALFGLSLWMGMRAFTRFRIGFHMPLTTLSLAVVAGLAIMLIHGLFDAVTWGTKPAVLAWILLGLAAILYLLSAERQETPL